MSSMTKNPKKTDNKKKAKAKPIFDIRNLPLIVAGIPDLALQYYDVIYTYGGPGKTTVVIREKSTQPGVLGKEVPLTDILLLNRAAGHVKRDRKLTDRERLLEKTRIFFYQNKISPTAVSDPAATVQTILSAEKDLFKTGEAVNRADLNNPADQAAVGFINEMSSRAKEAIKIFVESTKTGQQKKLADCATEAGLPASLKSKFLTGSLEVATNGNLWKTFVGKDPQTFCKLTLDEVQRFSAEKLKIFLDDDGTIMEAKALIDKAVLIYDKDDPKVGLNGLTSRNRDKILSQTIVTCPFVTKLDLLKFHFKKAKFPRLFDTKNSPFPFITEFNNDLLSKWFVIPPAQPDLVAEYWTKLSGQAVQSPELGTSYLEQAIGHLSKNEQKYRTIAKDGTYAVSNYSILCYKVEEVVNVGLESFQPIEIVGLPKMKTGKKAQRAIMMRKSLLSAKTKAYIRMLIKQNPTLSAAAIEEIKEYLMSISQTKIQEIASKLIVLTANLEEEDAAIQAGIEYNAADDDEEKEVEEVIPFTPKAAAQAANDKDPAVAGSV